jgi:uncharacterized protein
MSADESEGRPRRELAHRIFATEFDDADLSFAESDEERAPNYVVTPTGARANRLFVAGVLTERERLESDQIRARIADPTGVFVVYAGQYQPDALAALEGLSVPSFVAVTGKARTFQPEDSDRVFTSVRPETITEIDADTRDRWIVETAGRTIDRIEAFETALADEQSGGAEPDPTSGIALAREHYGTTPTYLDTLRGTAIDAAQVVAGESEAVAELTVSPAEGADRDVDDPVHASLDGRTVAAIDDGIETTTDDASIEPTDADFEPDAGRGSMAASDNPLDDGLADGESTDAPSASGLKADTDTFNGGTSDDSDTLDTTGEFDSTGGIAQSDEDRPVPEEAEDDAEAGDEPALSEAERATVEAEFDTGFTSGSEVEAAGEADIEPEAGAIGDESDDLPSATGLAQSETDPDGDRDTETDTGTARMPSDDDMDEADMPEESVLDDATTESVDASEESEPPSEPDDGAGATDPEAVDAVEAVMDAMRALDDGDGANRGAITERVSTNHGISEATADDAIQDALMGGQCYEPDDDVLKAI